MQGRRHTSLYKVLLSGCSPWQVVLQQNKQKGWDEMGLRNWFQQISSTYRTKVPRVEDWYLGSYTVHVKRESPLRGQFHNNCASCIAYLPWAVLLCEHVVDTREMTEREWWGICCVTSPWVSLKKQFKGCLLLILLKGRSGLKSSLYVPKGWIDRLLRHNYLPTVPKLLTNHAIVHFHQTQKRA